VRRLLLIGLGCGLVLAADAAQVRIPALAGGKASIQLVDAADRKTPVLGFVGPEWATTYSGLLLDTAKTVELTATADIATAGASTCYKVTVAASGGRGYDACVTVPPGSATHDLRTLAGAAVVPPASLLAGSLLPSTAGAAPGWGLVLADDLSVAWGALVAGGGGGGGGTWGSITGTLAAQLDLATALAGLAPLSHTQAATTITGLAPVATGGAYADLTGRPTLGTAAASAATDFATAAQGALAASASQPGHTQAATTITGLAPVATSGAYADLTGRPTLGTAAASAATDFATAAQGALAASASQPGHTQAATTITGLAPVATSGAYVSLAGRPTLGTAAAYAASDFATAAQGALAASASQPWHSHAPTSILGLAPVATSGAYADLTGRPTLGTAAASATTDFATAAQGALAASASQPGHTQAWGTLTATPTTRAGYGITDAAPLWMSVSTATGVGSATVDLSTTVEVYQMALTASGVLTIVQPTSGYRTVRLDVTSDTGARSWLISSIIAPSWARGIADDMTPPTGTGVVRSYWITGTPTTLSMSALTSWVPQ